MFSNLPRPPSDSTSSSASNGPQDPAAAIRLARVVHLMLISGMILFGGIAAFISIQSAPAEMPAEREPLPMVLIIVAGAMSATMVLPALVFGSGLIRTVLSKEGLSVAERAQRYVGGHVFLAALIEGPGLFWGVLTLITHDLLLLAGLGFSICALIAIGPRAGDWEDAGFDVRDEFGGTRSER